MNKNCLIADNNRKSVFQLQLLLHKNGFTKTFVISEPRYANKILEKENIEIIFVRTSLWHYFLLKAADVAQPPAVVFLSSRREKFKEDLKAQVEYHISEPYTMENIQAILQRTEKEKIQGNFDFLFIKQQRRYCKVFFEAIELAECLRGNYIRLHTTGGSYMVVGTLTAFMNRLPQTLFRRISDKLIIPAKDRHKIKGNVFFYKGRAIELTNRHLQYRQKQLRPL
jgi:hypothetical protein